MQYSARLPKFERQPPTGDPMAPRRLRTAMRSALGTMLRGKRRAAEAPLALHIPCDFPDLVVQIGRPPSTTCTLVLPLRPAAIWSLGQSKPLYAQTGTSHAERRVQSSFHGRQPSSGASHDTSTMGRGHANPRNQQPTRTMPFVLTIPASNLPIIQPVSSATGVH